MNSLLKQLSQDKPECVINFPQQLLSSQKINEYKSIRRIAIVEIAGRDSVAAAVKAVQDSGFTDLIPTYAYTGTEYGDWHSIETAVERLSGRLPGTRIHELLLIGSPRFWQALNGRFATELISRYGFYVPCVGCHLYLHSVRLPFSRLLGGVPLIAGERESHDGAVKINQVAEALESYEEIAKEFGTELIMPLRNISDGNRIRELLGFDWQEGGEQLDCVLSGNYRDVNGDVRIESSQVKQYLDEFACPVTRKIVRAYVEGDTPDHLKIAAELLNVDRI
jgi:hypothetical protein